jgi:myosin heavy subunit
VYDIREPKAFLVKHYAEPVVYNVDGWMNKNKDALNIDLARVLLESSSEFVQLLFVWSSLFFHLLI